MADPLLRLDATSVSVQPGGQVQVTVTVTSASDIVEGYRLTVLGGQPSRWAEVVPPTVNVYPGEEATAVVVFSPPSGTGAESGVFPFGVKAASTESADASSVVEGTVELGRVAGLQAKIIPVTSTGRWRGRHVIRLDNSGNAPARLRLVATDPDANLGFYVSPDVVDLPIGGSASVRLSARARRPFLRGAPVRHPFQVVGEPLGATSGPTPATPYGDPNRPVVDAALQQRPILTKGVVTFVSLLLVAALGGGAYAWTRPQGAPGSLAELGTPPAPEDFAAVGSDATSVRLRWKPVDQIDAYALQTIDPTDHDTVIGTTPRQRLADRRRGQGPGPGERGVLQAARRPFGAAGSDHERGLRPDGGRTGHAEPQPERVAHPAGDTSEHPGAAVERPVRHAHPAGDAVLGSDRWPARGGEVGADRIRVPPVLRGRRGRGEPGHRRAAGRRSGRRSDGEHRPVPDARPPRRRGRGVLAVARRSVRLPGGRAAGLHHGEDGRGDLLPRHQPEPS